MTESLGFQKIAKLTIFGIFNELFVHSKCKRSSLRSQCWMWLFCDFQPPCKANIFLKCIWIEIRHFCWQKCFEKLCHYWRYLCPFLWCIFGITLSTFTRLAATVELPFSLTAAAKTEKKSQKRPLEPVSFGFQ